MLNSKDVTNNMETEGGKVCKASDPVALANATDFYSTSGNYFIEI